MRKGLLYLQIGVSLLFFASRLPAQSFVTNGSATFLGGNCYQLTPDVGGQSGNIMSTNSIDMTQPFAFDAVLNFGVKDANGADGIVFLLATSNSIIGTGGGGIGYDGITPSIAIEYDDYFNSNYGDPTSDHMAVISAGSVNHNLSSNLVGPINLANIEDGEDHCFSVIWDPVTHTLTAALNSDLISYTGDIVNSIFSGNPNVYYGFSSGTGSLSNLHTVCFGPPMLVPMPDVTICEGDDVVLQADENGIAWTWTPSPTLSQLNISNPVADPVVTTTYTVTIDYACGGQARDTVIVTVDPEPTVLADNSGPVCPGESIQLTASGGTTFHWNGPMGFNSFTQNPVINNMTVGKTGLYTVTVTDAAGCTNTASTNVSLFPLPFVEVDPVTQSLCEDGDPVQLTASPSGGVWGGEVSSTGVFDPMQAGEGIHVITYTVTDGNGCTNSAQISIKVVPNIPAEIMPDGPFCLSEDLVTLTANPPGGMWGGIANSDGEIYPSSLFPGMFLVTYELTGVDECYNTEFFVEIVTPETVICPDTPPVCLNSPPVQLTASPAGGTWSGPVSSNGIADPMMLGPGDHQIFYSYSSGTCPPNTCYTILTVYDAPSTQNVVEVCDGTGTNYTVSFSISGGDSLTYIVNGTVGGNIIPGNPSTFVSAPIPSGIPYSFQVFDAHNCDTVTVAGNYACNCPTQAGTMDMTPFSVCAGDTISVLAPTGVFLDPNDTLIYVLHTGDPANYLLTGNGNQFSFGPPLQLGVPYFIAVLVGNTIPGVGVDLMDPCLAVSNGPSVIWNENPSGYISGPPMICTGDSAMLSFILSGTGPFQVSYSDGTNIFTLDSIFTGHSVTVHPIAATTYTLINLSEKAGPGCVSDPDTSLTIAVSDIIHAQEVIMMCDGDSVFLAGAYQFQQGVFYDSIPGTIGCDTLLESYLIVHPLDTTYIQSTTCDNSQAGTFQNLYSNQNGCDSLVVNTVILIAADTTLINSTTCDPQTAGVFTNTFTGQNGCDSVVISTIVLLPSDTTYLSGGNCDPSATGIFTQILTNSMGCDSVVIETVVLLPGDTTLLNASSCIPSDTGTVSTLYQNIFGCDSLVIENTQFISSWLIMDTATTCDPAASGTFTTHFVSSQGCDSTVVEEVILLPSEVISLFDQTCIPADTGVLTQHYTNSYGCDSTVQIVTSLLPPDSCIVVSHDVFVPNVFSPNQDGVNDVVFLSSPTHSVEAVNYFRIFDRWGSLVFDRRDILPNDPEEGWDGTMREKNLNPAVFVWVAEVRFEDGVEEVLYGDVTLVR